MSEENEKLAYYQLGGLLKPRWELHEGERGCTPVEIEDVCMKQERPPPKLMHTSSPPAPPKPREKPPAAKNEEWARMATDVLDFIEWVNKPPAPKNQSTQPKLIGWEFDIQDIPRAMDELGLHMAAKFMRRWFAGQLNYSRTKNDEAGGIDQFGEPYSKSMIDTESVKMEELLQHSFIREKYTELFKKAIYRPPLCEC
jgi:hypothetical protein